MRLTTAVVTTVATCALCITPTAQAAAVSFYLGGTRQNGQPEAVSQGEAEAYTGDPAAIPILYPRDLAPLVGTKSLDRSVAEGRAALHQQADPYIGSQVDQVRVVGVSQGAVVAQLAKKDWATTDPGATNVSFLTFGDPTNTDGGVLGKIPSRIKLPGYFTPVRADDDTPFDTTTVAIEYDLIADAPDRPNALSWVNAAMGAIYYHSTYTGDMAERTEGVVITTNPPNSKGGTTTHVLVKTPDLPLVQPLRNMGVDEDVVEAIEKPLKKIVDAGYQGDRGNDVMATGNKVKPGQSFKDKLKVKRDKTLGIPHKAATAEPKPDTEPKEPDSSATGAA